ncbi:hypothetical protein EW026_g3294 [Hermanssonia centrifuga]|uniref:Prephenate/arogenate dehydrogenase domain-containing protein n=1 Tax=Hermanssonia centrifuga TaxID=98765 RepID=A0A4V3XAQ2_9APHY|nr:hypothetical protein EW026_g3294 [Hermanssonia centrifuga]
MIRPDVTPDAPLDAQPGIGLIGMGAMGTMYAKYLSAAGWKRIYVCDIPSKYQTLKDTYQDTPGITVLPDGHGVSRISDWIMYSVEAEYIERVVKEYGPSTKVGAIVAGQTSVKAPERAAFEKHLPQDVHIVSCHSLHGPTVSPLGQPLVLIKHRAPDSALQLVESILRPLQSRYVYLSYEDHDIVTANTQAVTHAAFLSMVMRVYVPVGAWLLRQGNRDRQGQHYASNYSNKWHVYAGLAILNPSARIQIDQYARSTSEIFKLMLSADDVGLRQRIYGARDAVFGAADRAPILLSEDILDRFSLGRRPSVDNILTPIEGRAPANSHLSLLAMVDCWARLGIQPFVHLDLAATPIFRLWIGVAEYLFRSQERLDAAIFAALYDSSHRSNDMEFVIAARGWSQCISFGNFDLYKERFSQSASFFQSRFEDATKVGSAMIQAIMDSSKERKDDDELGDTK